VDPNGVALFNVFVEEDVVRQPCSIFCEHTTDLLLLLIF
jgi:hypothetical protein